MNAKRMNEGGAGVMRWPQNWISFKNISTLNTNYGANNNNYMSITIGFVAIDNCSWLNG